MHWRKIGDKEFPALLDFILPLEKYCSGFTSRLISENGPALPPKREALIYAACTGTTASGDQSRDLRPEQIRGAVLMTSRGMIMPVHQPGTKLPENAIRDIMDTFYRYSRKIYCIIGLSQIVQHYEKALREKIDTRILYHLMHRSDSSPLPRNIFPQGLRMNSLNEKDLEAVYPLEVEYQYEEVLVHPERFSPSTHLVHFKKQLREQKILFATLNGEPAAKVGTNAIGFGYCQIGGVYTAKPYRRMGISRSLMIRLLEEIHNRGSSAVLFVRKSNKAAVQLYRKLGFDIIGEYQITYTKLD